MAVKPLLSQGPSWRVGWRPGARRRERAEVQVAQGTNPFGNAKPIVMLNHFQVLIHVGPILMLGFMLTSESTLVASGGGGPSKSDDFPPNPGTPPINEQGLLHMGSALPKEQALLEM